MIGFDATQSVLDLHCSMPIVFISFLLDGLLSNDIPCCEQRERCDLNMRNFRILRNDQLQRRGGMNGLGKGWVYVQS